MARFWSFTWLVFAFALGACGATAIPLAERSAHDGGVLAPPDGGPGLAYDGGARVPADGGGRVAADGGPSETPSALDGGHVAADGGPPLDCGEIVACTGECATTSCAAACRVRGSFAGRERLGDYQRCIDQRCAGFGGSSVWPCVQRNCAPELVACFGGGSGATGNATCEDVEECSAGCAPGDYGCYGDCYDSATSEAQTARSRCV